MNDFGHDKSQAQAGPIALWRLGLVAAGLLLMASALVWRALDLQVLDKEFLQGQGDARHLRVLEQSAHRGMLLDREGEPLAISSPVASVWVNPSEVLAADGAVAALARHLGLDAAQLRRRLVQRADREFFYVKRHITPDLAERVESLRLPGVALQREYQRFYPAGEVTAHVVGFTDIDDVGQEGVELAFHDWLSGEPGARRVIKDRYGRIIDDVENLRDPKPGQDLQLSIDRRLQYLAYRELKAAVRHHRARSGSLVMLDVRTGEVLAMVNQPAFNPNNRAAIAADALRNRAVTDTFEPGSTIKPFAVLAALEAGVVTPATMVDTGPGYVRVGGHVIRDVRNYGQIDVATVLMKSSTVGMTKIALQTDAEALWGVMSRLGFGVPTALGFPGEAAGQLASTPPERDIERAAMSYGYGLAVTPLQLARAYAVLANDGVAIPLTLIKRTEPVSGRQMLDPAAVAQIHRMLEGVVSDEGTASRADVGGYRVAGKTGTAKKSVAGGYSDDRYVALFAGFAPASKPRIAMAVVINEPRGEAFYGGQVAAPVFSRVMGGALRLLDVTPDDLTRLSRRPSTADADPLVVTGRTPCGRLDVVSATSAPSSGPCTPSQRRLDALVTKDGETGGPSEKQPLVAQSGGGK